MFEDTLLIIKADYMHKRKQLLVCLSKRGFQIQGRRLLLFSPELAAEFYEDIADNPDFMMQVILLSKGHSEAYILAKVNAAQDLLNAMICYFGTSAEMDCNVHVTNCRLKVQREISFIFPNCNYIMRYSEIINANLNYFLMTDIHEPIYCPEQLTFCSKTQFIKPLIQELYDITTETEPDHNKEWKVQVADHLRSSNRKLPKISNLGIRTAICHLQEKGQQTKCTSFKSSKIHTGVCGGSMATLRSQSVRGSSANISSSSCVSCTDFGSTDERIRHTHRKLSLTALVKAKTAPLAPSSPDASDDEKADEARKKKILFAHVQVDVIKQVGIVKALRKGDELKEAEAKEEAVVQQEIIKGEMLVSEMALEEVSEKPEQKATIKFEDVEKIEAERHEDEKPIAEDEQLAPKEPVTEEHVAEKKVAEAPATEEPVIEESKDEKPVIEESKDEKPVIEESKEEKPVIEESKEEKPVIEEPVMEGHLAEEPTVKDEQSAAEQPAVEHAAEATDHSPATAAEENAQEPPIEG